MANYQHKRSAVTGKIPLASDLLDGEIAINIKDRKVFAKDDQGIVFAFSGGNGGAVDTVNNIAPVNGNVTLNALSIPPTSDRLWLTQAERQLISGVEQGAQVNTVNTVVGRTGDITLSTQDIDSPSGINTQQFIDNFELKIFQSPTDNLIKVSTFAGGVGVVYEVRKTSDNTLATIYSDKDGVTEILQNGTANVSNGDAEAVFYVDDGDYTVTVGGFNSNFTTISKKFKSISSLLGSQGRLINGAVIEVESYYEGHFTGGGKFYWDELGAKSEHDGGYTIDPTVNFYSIVDLTSVANWYRASNAGTGVYRRIKDQPITDDMYGVINSASYDFKEAFVNRYAYETLLRNTEINDVTFTSKPNPVFVWGSINVGRSDLTIRHLAGCDIRGRYSDPDEPADGQAGHMFGFVDYTDPYPNSDYTVSGNADRINYILDGKASTIFNAGHTKLHNNNAIAFYKGDDCSVTGTGGVPQCDHNAIAFDGLSRNPKVDIAYVRNYDDRAVTMKGEVGADSAATVKIGELSGKTGNGTVSESILVQDLSYAKVEVGNAILFAGSLGTFVNSKNCDLVDVSYGYLENAIFVAAFSDTGQININGGRYKNVTYQFRRGGTAPESKPLRKLSLKGCELVDSLNSSIYISQITPNEGNFDEFEVVDCDFSKATGTLTPYVGKVGASTPSLFNFRNNRINSSWVYDSSIFNENLNRINTGVGSTSFNYDIAGENGDNPYQKITVIMTHSGDSFRYAIDINLKDLQLTSAEYRYGITTDDGSVLELTTTRSGTVVTFTVSATVGTGSISSYSLSN